LSNSSTRLAISARGRTLAAAAHLEAEGDILRHRHMTEQRVLLEHKAGFALARRDRQPVQTVERHLADIGEFQPAEDAQQRGLARAGRTQQRDKAPCGASKLTPFSAGKRPNCLATESDDKRHFG
jgi:hypothetical protein